MGSSRSYVKPLIIMAVMVALAIGAGLFLVKRQSPEASGSDVLTSPLDFKPVITTKGWNKGNPNAKTVLVEFGDFQCAACAAARLPVMRIVEKHSQDLLLVFKHYPLPQVHRNSMIAAQAAEAAGRQFRFWEMYDVLFQKQSEWSAIPDPLTYFLKYAADLQLDLERFRQDLWDGQLRDKILRDVLEGQVGGVKSVPTFFVNGNMLPRPQNDSHFEDMIADAIKKAHETK
ncbi:MAG: thioredoxin domain-containing protein [Acidobacteriota bacterium]